jgi:xanthine dehydrogenase YagR molybdenum-binding subunit
MAQQPASSSSPIGRDTLGIDGPRKVAGLAKYAADFQFPGMLYAVPVEATVASGTLLTLDTTVAENMPGVRAVLHRHNIGPIFRSTPAPGFERVCLERRPPFEDDTISYWSQYIALAVADTFEAARAAADAVRATYSPEKPNVGTRLETGYDPDVVLTAYGSVERVQSRRGDAAAGFKSAAVTLDETYVTPAETHNPLELHATVALWDGATLTLYDATQGVVNLPSVLAQMFRLPRENVRVVSKFLGSGFGGKLYPWPHVPLAAAAARQLGKPVKLVASRKMMFQSVGHRAHTQQRVRLGASRDGTLASLEHDYVYHMSMLDMYHEDCGDATPFHNSVPNLRVSFGRARRITWSA